jgi:2-keto-4-pentenoate hydratase
MPVDTAEIAARLTAALGHPASAVAWLVRSLAAENPRLRTGDVVLSGGLTAAIPVIAGDVVTVTADRLGSVEVAWR